MKVRMTKTAAGPDGVLMSGKIYELPEQEAKTLVAAKAAIFDFTVQQEPEPAQEEEQEQTVVETASIESERKAVRPKAKPKNRNRKMVRNDL